MFEFGGISSFYGLNDQILPLRPSSYWLETFLFSLIVLSHAHDLIDKRSSLTTYGIAGKYCAFVKQRYIYVVTPDCFNEHELTIFCCNKCVRTVRRGRRRRMCSREKDDFSFSAVIRNSWKSPSNFKTRTPILSS